MNDPLRAFFTFCGEKKKPLDALFIMTFSAINKVMCAWDAYEMINSL